MTTGFDKDIADQLRASPPRSALVIDPLPGHALSSYAAGHPECRVTRLGDGDPLARLAALGRFDVALVANTLEHMDKAGAGRLIARLRDLNTRCLFAVVPIGPRWRDTTSAWEPADLIAFGMTRIGDRRCERGPLQLYKFDIADYKKNPDWLNPDHWANPELWDKYRW